MLDVEPSDCISRLRDQQRVDQNAGQGVNGPTAAEDSLW